MEDKENDVSLEKLSEILSTLQNLYYRKREQLEELQDEINDIKDILNYFNSMVSRKSFHRADEIYQEKMMETYLKDDISTEATKGTSLKRKIFSQDHQDLLGILKFIDSETIEIKFLEPDQRSITESSEDFINIFLRGALIPIKEDVPNLQANYEYYKNTNFIEKIIITNVKSIHDFDLVSEKISELLLGTSSPP
ncbi:MAG: hypothetical protein EU539_00950 [Promethearchaeota archaeon]|nr:MAG: hypothetical protein EU539_00950 [Candidatus Lokiarchaeota archaeon]